MLASECLQDFVESRLSDYANRDFDTSPPAPYPDSDVWLLASLVQKAVRRSDLEAARRAGHQLLRLDAPRLWRRLMTLALEDVGLGDPLCASEIVAISTSAEIRKRVGLRALDVALAAACEAVKDRGADHLISILRRADFTHGPLAFASLNARQAVLASRAQPWMKRVEAGWLIEHATVRSGTAELFEALEGLGAPAPFVAACKIYRRRGRDGLAAAAGMAWALRRAETGASKTKLRAAPAAEPIDGVPAYAYDPLHTRLGQRAVELWLRSYLTKLPFNARQVAAALWNWESAFCTRELDWPLGRQIAGLASECDLLGKGLPRERHGEIVAWIERERGGLGCARRAVAQSERRRRALFVLEASDFVSRDVEKDHT
jgi:hypothetical protein